ncbi:hypothetical protein LTV02_33860 [Nocardia yamanashiensis]|uniref:hypothetical protein n=1 Tax=Nocardia yamanashiensis TaxID=209247 RepID=UPI001E44C8D2|nr:hypothetical protein [Nocardia yamanashiensis]UGT40906.1 hypothetical protein LTV02_33860 [Nocardia yamanashiensis]
MSDSPDTLEERISELRTAVRRAISAGDRTSARQFRVQLRQAERDWEAAVLSTGEDASDEEISVPAVPVREHVHRALALLSVPAAPRLILSVHEGFFSGELLAARLTSLRRDEERSFRAAPFARPYYVCSALTVDLLAPARGLMALSTWQLERRVVGPLSARVDLLTGVIRLAEHISAVGKVGPSGHRVLRQLSSTIPGVRNTGLEVDTRAVIEAAGNELAVHRDADVVQRWDAAQRAANQLSDPAAQLFGTRFGMTAKKRAGGSAG